MSDRAPRARGPISRVLMDVLHDRREFVDEVALNGELLDEDLHVALWTLNRLCVTGFDSIDDRHEGRIDLVLLHRRLEQWFEDRLRDALPSPVGPLATMIDHLIHAPGPDVLGAVRARGPAGSIELLAVRSAYLGREADPHTLALARLPSPIQSIVAEIQSGEYGVGHDRTHAQIYRSSLGSVRPDLVETIDHVPGPWIAVANLAWLFGSSRRLAAASVGQLCLYEMDSVDPCRRWSAEWQRVGLPAEGRRWYDVHVLADAEHAQLVSTRLVPLVAMDDTMHAGAVFGAAATHLVHDLANRHLVNSWRRNESALAHTPPMHAEVRRAG